MKKFAILVCALFPAVSAFAYGDYGYSSHGDEMSGFAIFTLIVMVVYIILSIIVLVRWWNMTSNIKDIKTHLTHNYSLTYLVAIGELEQANKVALTMLVDRLMPIYFDQLDYNKVDTMNKYITTTLPKMEKLGLTLPDYVKSGEKFIDYINGLTGNKVSYHLAHY